MAVLWRSSRRRPTSALQCQWGQEMASTTHHMTTAYIYARATRSILHHGTVLACYARGIHKYWTRKKQPACGPRIISLFGHTCRCIADAPTGPSFSRLHIQKTQHCIHPQPHACREYVTPMSAMSHMSHSPRAWECPIDAGVVLQLQHQQL